MLVFKFRNHDCTTTIIEEEKSEQQGRPSNQVVVQFLLRGLSIRVCLLSPL